MKKFYLLTFFLPVLAFAQPTIQASDEPVMELYVGTGIDNNYNAAITAGGANVTWDYSTLQFVDSGGVHFVDVEGTPYQNDFPTATLAVHDSVKHEWIYFRTAANGFYTVGLDSAGTQVHLSPDWLFMPVPFTYLNTRNSTARIQVDTPITYMSVTYPGRVVRTYQDYFEADGHGTLILPTGSIPNTLRIKDRQLVSDTVYVEIISNFWYPAFTQQSQTHNFRWVRSNGPDAFLLELRADSLGTTATRSEYQWISIISVPEINKETVHVTPYPNPSNNVVHLNFDKGTTGTISVYNSLNQLVRTSSFTDINHYTMYVSDMADGHYHFIVNTSETVREGSFIVSH